MAYRVKCVVRSGVLAAVVSGRTSVSEASSIARVIGEQASGESVTRVLIDLRRLADRLGSLGELALSIAVRRAGYRVAVVDSAEYDGYYALHESTAKRRGFELRSFSDSSAAASWLMDERG